MQRDTMKVRKWSLGCKYGYSGLYCAGRDILMRMMGAEFSCKSSLPSFPLPSIPQIMAYALVCSKAVLPRGSLTSVVTYLAKLSVLQSLR